MIARDTWKRASDLALLDWEAASVAWFEATPPLGDEEAAPSHAVRRLLFDRLTATGMAYWSTRREQR